MGTEAAIKSMEDAAGLQSFLQKVLDCSALEELDPEVKETLQNWNAQILHPEVEVAVEAPDPTEEHSPLSPLSDQGDPN